MKKKRSMAALQSPTSSFRAHSSLKMSSSGCAASAEVGETEEEVLGLGFFWNFMKNVCVSVCV